MYSLVHDTADAPAPLTTIFTSSIFFPATFQGVQQSGAGDDGRAVLVVVHDGDVEFLF